MKRSSSRSDFATHACVTLLTFSCACASDPAPTPSGDDASAPDAQEEPSETTTGPTGEETRDAAAEPDAEPTEPPEELAEVVAEAIAVYAQQIEETCPCFVEIGAYASLEECLMFSQAAEDWVPCATEALMPFDSPETRESLLCLEDVAERNSECFAETTCGSSERSSCTETLLSCFYADPSLIITLDAACPDFSLLPRQPVPDADPVPDPALVEIVNDFIDTVDETAEATCPCQVEVGGYASVQECLDYNQTTDGAAECMARALAPFDSPELRENLECMVALGASGIECYADTECGTSEQSSCIESPLTCYETPPPFIAALSEECPEQNPF